jgi:threonine dehydrogenase-like Zn-dependent dehydrogenase
VATPTGLHLAPIVVDEVTLVGSRCGPFGTAIEALRTKRIEVASLVHDVYRLTDAAQAVEAAAQPGATKILLAVDETAPSIKRLKG